jgi:predicted ATPase with chaperone activity
MYLFDDHGLPLPEAHLRAVARPHRHASRVEVPRVDYEKLSSDRLGEPSGTVRARVEAASERQRARLASTSLTCNADRAQPPCGMGQAEICQCCQVDAAAQSLLKAVSPALRAAQVCSRCISARGPITGC